MADNPSTVMTVSGPLKAEQLGITLVHEHLLGTFAPPRDDTPEGWASIGLRRHTSASDAVLYESPLTIDRIGSVWLGAVNRDNLTLDDEALAADELRKFAALGGATVVDYGTPTTGRDPEGLKRLAEATGLNIVMAAGWRAGGWLDDDDSLDAVRLAESLIGEITNGVGESSIRAGVLGELRIVDPSAHRDRTLLNALGAASRATAAPLTVSSLPSLDATLELIAILESEGVDLRRVAIGHAEVFALDPDALAAILDHGVYVAFDQLGRIPTVLTEVSDHDVSIAIASLAEHGQLDRVLVSQGISSKICLQTFGGGGYSFILEQFVPYFTRLGGSDAEVTTLLVDNPRRFLTGERSAS